MKISGSRKTKTRLNKSIVVLDPKTEIAAAPVRPKGERVVILNPFEFVLPVETMARHENWLRKLLKNTIAESETPE